MSKGRGMVFKIFLNNLKSGITLSSVFPVPLWLEIYHGDTEATK